MRRFFRCAPAWTSGSVIAAGITLLSFVSPARSQLILDQSNVVSAPPYFAALLLTTQSFAQTFTVGTASVLASVDLQIYKNTGATGDIIFDIRTTENGVPNRNNQQSLFSTVIPLNAIPTIDSGLLPVPLTSIDVSATQIAVQTGDVLALSLSRVGVISEPWAAWRMGSPVYPGGSAFNRPNTAFPWQLFGSDQDAGFRTSVDVGPLTVIPEPSTAAILASGLLPLAGVVIRNRRARTAS